MIGALVALLLGAAVADDGLSDTERVDGALLQVRLWLDLGELGKADTLTRRGVTKLPDDVRWHRARLDALHAAGMDPWIEAEYARARLDPAVAVAYAAWEVDVGRRLGIPPEVEGPGLALARARVALRHGDLDAAGAEARASDDDDHLALRAELAAATGSGAAMTVLLDGWPEEAPVAPLAPVFRACAATTSAKACAARLAAIRAAVPASSDVLALLDDAVLGVGTDDAPLLAAVHARLEALRVPHDVQAQMDGFSAGPVGWKAWEVPRRPRLSGEALDALGADLAARGETTVPWGRPDERRRIAVALAEKLQARREVLAADRVLVDVLGPCTPSVAADVLISTGHAREGRELAVGRLLACLGRTDLLPDEDPAGLAVDVAVADVADAWFRFGRTAQIGRWDTDAALAFGLAARLSPDPDVVAAARLQARAVGWTVDGSGLPAVVDLIGRLDAAAWLHPLAGLDATRAGRARAATIAWLDPTPEHLAARVTPDSLCVPTIRSRCQLERAVAARAFERAKRPPPSDLARASDPGALLAADRVLDRIRQLGFQRRAELVRLLEREVPRDMDEILAGRPGAKVGYRAPRWSSGGVRSVDLDGRVVVLVFWAGFSRPSLAELLIADGLATRWEADHLDVRLIGVDVDDTDLEYRRALARLEVGATTLLRDPDLRTAFSVRQLPTIAVVDAAGVLRELRPGYDGGDLSWLDGAVRSWAALATERP